MCDSVNVAYSPWIGHRGSPTSTLDNTTTTTKSHSIEVEDRYVVHSIGQLEISGNLWKMINEILYKIAMSATLL